MSTADGPQPEPPDLGPLPAEIHVAALMHTFSPK